MEQPNEHYKKIFARFVPAQAVSYCFGLWNELGFEFQIKKSRQTKLGDYRYTPDSKKHTITINNDLNSYSFLVTYLHEVAHMITFQKHGRKVSPHGSEWKDHFRKVAEPLLTEDVFPITVLTALVHYFKNPKAASCSDPTLYNVLKQFDSPSGQIPLSKITPGQFFSFKDVVYQKLEKKRTRSVCLDIRSKKRYLIPEVAPVTPTD